MRLSISKTKMAHAFPGIPEKGRDRPVTDYSGYVYDRTYGVMVPPHFHFPPVRKAELGKLFLIIFLYLYLWLLRIFHTLFSHCGFSTPKVTHLVFTANFLCVQSDNMDDIDYMKEVMKMSPQEITGLMRSEEARLRTYKKWWPKPKLPYINELAREGFYYTGESNLLYTGQIFFFISLLAHLYCKPKWYVNNEMRSCMFPHSMTCLKCWGIV